VQGRAHLVVGREAGVLEGLVEAGDRSPVHVVVLAVAAVDPHDGGLVTVCARVGRRSAERLRPVGCEAPRVVGLEAVTEGVAHDLVREDASVPSLRQPQESRITTGRLVHADHGQTMPPSSPADQSPGGRNAGSRKVADGARVGP
jgi:hypothetical protein